MKPCPCNVPVAFWTQFVPNPHQIKGDRHELRNEE